MPVLLYDEDHEDGRPLPSRWVICRHCEGKGTSSAYLGAFTAEEMDEEGRDFQEDYMAGHYDRACEPCRGTGKVEVIDRKRCTVADLRAYSAQVRDEREQRALEESERRHGA